MSTTNEAAKADGEATDIDPGRLLQRVWRGLKDGDCLNCDTLSQGPVFIGQSGMQCPNCKFTITGEEIAEIKKIYAPARRHAVTMFKAWQGLRKTNGQ
jgi:hypothetical protein